MMINTNRDCGTKKGVLPILLALFFLISGCGMAASYRPTDQKTLNDINATHDYRKKIGVLAMVNATTFTSDRISVPFMERFLSALKSSDRKAQLLLFDDVQNAPFLNEPPLDEAGRIDSFILCEQARREGVQAIVRPVIMDVRAGKKFSGFWLWRKLHHWLDVQAMARAYDTATGASLSFTILTERIDINAQQYQMIEAGQEVDLDALLNVIKDMGHDLGREMGNAIDEIPWMTNVISADSGLCELPAGKNAGIETGDSLIVLSTNGTITGADDQRYIIPWNEVGWLKVTRVTAEKSFAAPETGELPPVGSIVAR